MYLSTPHTDHAMYVSKLSLKAPLILGAFQLLDSSLELCELLLTSA